MPRTLLLVLLLLSFLRVSAVYASEVVRPDSKLETQAARVLWNLNLKLRKAKPSNPITPDELSSYPFRRVALSLARLGRVETALRVVDWKPLPDMSYARNEVLRLAVRRSAKLGKIEQAKSLLPQINNHYAKADALLVLAKAYLREHDYANAQKVLFEVTPQVPDNYQVLLYTAVLFAKNQNIAVSKRLFERAKKMIPSDEEYKNRKHNKPGLTPFNQRARFGYSLLQARFVGQWLKYRTSEGDQPTFPSNREVSLLLERNNAGTLLEAVQRITPRPFNVNFMINVAERVASKEPERSLAILDKASAFWIKQAKVKSAAESQQKHFGLILTATIKYKFAQAYAKLGKKEISQEWMQRLTERPKQGGHKFDEFYYRLLPIVVFAEDKSTFPPQQLMEINKSIQPFLSSLPSKFESEGFQKYIINSLVQQLIKMQIAAGQRDQARENIEFLETYLRKFHSADMSAADLFHKSLDIAALWKSVGDQKKCEALLEFALDADKKTSSDYALFNISTLARKGFLHVARREFHALSPEELKRHQASGIEGEIITQEAIAHPRRFLSQQLKEDTSPTPPDQLYQEVNILFPFVKHLTRSLFPQQNEPQHMLTSAGMVYFSY